MLTQTMSTDDVHQIKNVQTQFRCKLCMKERPASLKSQFIDRLHRFFI